MTRLDLMVSAHLRQSRETYDLADSLADGVVAAIVIVFGAIGIIAAYF